MKTRKNNKKRKSRGKKLRGGTAMGSCACNNLIGGSNVNKMAKAIVPLGLFALTQKKIYKKVVSPFKNVLNKTRKNLKKLFKF